MRILVGVDGSGPSIAALDWAIGRALNLDAPLVAVHVVDDEWGQMGSEYAREETERGWRILHDAKSLVFQRSPNLDFSAHILHGSPAWELASAAEAGDLVAVGTHKTGYLRGRVLGTRSIVVASVAVCPVAVIPDAQLASRSGVVVGVAPGNAWRDAVRTGAREAERLRQELVLIHARPGSGESVRSEVLDRTLLADASDVAASVAAVAMRTRTSRRRPAEALLDASRNASLLVVGASRRESANAGFVGSVTHDVLLNINAPVMVARTAGPSIS